MEPLLRALLAALLTLCPGRPPERVEPLARDLLAVTQDPRELALLGALSWHENSLGAAGVPFGALACRCRGASFEHYARWTLATLRTQRRRLGGWTRALGWWHTGAPRSDPYVRRVERTWSRLAARLAREARRAEAP